MATEHSAVCTLDPNGVFSQSQGNYIYRPFVSLRYGVGKNRLGPDINGKLPFLGISADLPRKMQKGEKVVSVGKKWSRLNEVDGN